MVGCTTRRGTATPVHRPQRPAGKLKFQYFGHLMQRADSLEKTLMLWKTEGRRRGRQRRRWLDDITDSMDMSLSKLRDPNSCPSSWRCHPAISSSVVPFSSCSQSFPGSGSFPMSQLFTAGGQSTGVSALASFLPKKSQG